MSSKCESDVEEKGYPPDVDIYRETPVRLLGYANEVGEALRALVPANVVHASYGIASLYVLADTVDKTLKANRQTDDKVTVALAAADTLVWQTLASVVIPGFTINRICAGSLWVLANKTKLPSKVRKWLTLGVGIASIPFIVKPIDTGVDYMLDNTTRTWFDMPLSAAHCHAK